MRSALGTAEPELRWLTHHPTTRTFNTNLSGAPLNGASFFRLPPPDIERLRSQHAHSLLLDPNRPSIKTLQSNAHTLLQLSLSAQAALDLATLAWRYHRQKSAFPSSSRDNLNSDRRLGGVHVATVAAICVHRSVYVTKTETTHTHTHACTAKSVNQGRICVRVIGTRPRHGSSKRVDCACRAGIT